MTGRYRPGPHPKRPLSPTNSLTLPRITENQEPAEDNNWLKGFFPRRGFVAPSSGLIESQHVKTKTRLLFCSVCLPRVHVSQFDNHTTRYTRLPIEALQHDRPFGFRLQLVCTLHMELSATGEGIGLTGRKRSCSTLLAQPALIVQLCRRYPNESLPLSLDQHGR